MLTPVRSTAFRKDVKRARKRGKDMRKLKAVIEWLIEGKPLDPRLRDHPLKGEWAGWRDLHIEPGWLLLYRASGEELQLARTGTHSDLFGE
ncbi:MAG: type II toxin-antitoxin system YafQ family toxin [Sphingomonadales bacterium]|nr:type II toxin-antitoxin system YafQ family toxin [Sphingomonadales bacterium]